MGEYIDIYKDYKKHRVKPKTVVTTQDREPEKNTGGLLGGIGYTAGKLGLGVAGVGEGVLDTGAAIFDVLRGDLESAKDRYKENVTGDLSRDLEEWYNPNGVMRFVGDTASGIGQSSVFLLDTVVPGLGTGLFFTGVGGQNVASAAEQTGNVGWRELGYGAASAGLEAVIGKAIGAGGQATKQLGGAILKSTGKTAAKKAAQTTGKGAIKNLLIEVGKSAAGEGLEEGVSEVADTWLLQWFGIDEDAETSILDVLYAAGVGAVSGGLMTAGPAAINYNQTVKAGRAVKEAGEVDILLQRAKNAVAGATRAENRAAGEVIKGSDKYDKDANVFSRAASWNKATLWDNRRAKKESRQAKQIRETLEKNITGYENLSEAVRNSEGGDALLGNMLGNVYLLENAYRVDLTEELMTRATPEMKQAFVDDINAKAKATGQKKTDYTVQDLDNDVDGIRRTYASSAVYEMMLEKMYGVENATETAEEAQEGAEKVEDEEVSGENVKTATAENWVNPGKTEDEVIIYDEARRIGLDNIETELLVNTYNRGVAMDPLAFTNAFAEGTLYGKYNIDPRHIREGSLLARMNPFDREQAFEAGRISALEEAIRRDKEAEKKKAPVPKKTPRTEAREGTVHKDPDIKLREKTDQQYTAYQAARLVAKVTGVDIYFHETLGEKDGGKINGYFDKSNNTIHIALDAGKDARGTALFTLAHEVTHYIREWSPAKFEAISDFVGERMGADMEGLMTRKAELLRKMPQFKDKTVTELNDAAHEEVIADAMETILSDGTVMEDLATYDKSLWEKIKDFIVDLIKKIKKAYGELSPNSQAAKVLKDTVDDMSEIQRLWAEGVREAGERTRTAGVETVTRMNEEKMHVIRKYSVEYENAEPNQSIIDMVKKVKTGIFNDNDPVELGYISDKNAEIIKKLTGINVNGYKMVIEARQIRHILRDHGENGLANQSMADPNDIAKMEYALENPDTIVNAGKTKAYSYMKNGYNRTADTVRYEKNIGEDNYYVIQAVPEAKAKTLFVVGAYIGNQEHNKKASQPASAHGTNRAPNATSENAATDAFGNRIPQEPDSVNRKFSISEEIPSTLSTEALENELNSAGLILTSKENQKNNKRITRYIEEKHPDLVGRVEFENNRFKGTVRVKRIQTDEDISKEAERRGEAEAERKERQERREAERRFFERVKTPSGHDRLIASVEGYLEKSGLADRYNATVERSHSSVSSLSFYVSFETPDGWAEKIKISDHNTVWQEIQHRNAGFIDLHEYAGFGEIHKRIREIITQEENEDVRYSIEETDDTAYLAAVESGDMDTAQKMVDEAAKAAGYKIKAYHGTNAEFTTFEYGHIGESSGVGILGDGFYFTDEKELSKQYGKRTLDCYIRIRNPYMATTGDLYNLDTITLENEGYDGVILKVPKGTIYMTFESEQIKSADPVTYDDNGNVIPLSERFQESKSDIRYSIEETDETPAPFAAAEARMKARMKAEAAARAEAKTKAETETEGDEIPDVYEFVDEDVTDAEIEAEMSEGEELSDRDMLIDMAERLVGNEEENKILESYKAQYGEQKERQKKLDNLFSEMDTQKSILYTDENAEKRSAAAKRLKEISTEIEKISEELGAVDRELTKIKDMKAIKNLLVRERKTARKIYQEKYRRMGEARKEATATTNMRRSFYRIYSGLNTMLLKPNRKKHVHYSMQGMVAEALKTANIDLDATLRLEQLNTWLTRAEREAVRDEAKIERYKSLIHEQEKKVTHIKDQVAMLVSLFEEFSKSTESEIAYAANADVMEQLKALQKEIGDRAPRWMTLKQLTALKDFYDMIYTRVTKANELFMSKKDVAVSEAGDTSATQVNKNKAPKVFERKERLPKALVLARNFLWQNMKPLTAFEVIGSSKLSELFGNVMDGEDVWARDVEAAYQFIRKLKEKTGFDKWDLKERMEVETSNGKKVKLSRGEIMSLYAYGFREQAEKHLTDGGFVLDPYAEDNIPEDDEKIKLRIQRLVDDPTRYRMDAVALGRLTGMLTEEQKTFVKEMQTYLSDVMGEKGNEVSRKLYGVELFREKNYFPIKVSSVYLESHTGRTGDPNIKSRGMTKDTVPNANNPLILQDFMTVCSDHINSMSTYHAFVLPVEDLMRVLNYAPSSVKMDENGNPVKDEKGNYVSVDPDVQFNTVKAAIVAKYGQEAVSYIEQVIRDLNGGARRDAAASILDKGLTAFKRASTMASLSVIFQQPTSLFRAMAYVDPKYFMGKAEALSGKKRKERFDLLKKYAAVAVIKEMGGYDTNTGKRTEDYLNSKEYKDIREKMEAFFKPEAYGGDSNYRAEIFGKGAAIADEVTWVNIFSACIKEQSEKLNKAETSEEVLEAAGRRFTEVVRRTQVYDSTLTRNQLMRSKDTGAKMITTFMSEPSTVVNMVVDGMVRASRGDKAFLARTAGGVAASILANALLVSLIYAIRDDDEEKTFSEKYMSTLVTESLEGINPLEYLPIARDVMSIMKGYDVERSDMALIGQLVQSVENITSSKKSVPDKMMEVSGAVSSFFGVPLKNIYRDARGILTTAGDFFSDSSEKDTGTGMAFAIKDEFTFINKLFGLDSSNGYQMYKAILSGDEAHYNRVAARFSTHEAAESALRTAMREHDERIYEAAEKRNAGDLEGYEAMVDKMASEGKFDRNLIIQAIRNESYELKKIAEKQAGMNLAPEADPEDDEADAAEGLYVTSDMTSAMERGDVGDLTAIIEQMVRDKVDSGKTEKEAKASLRSASTAYWKKRYIAAWENNDYAEMLRIRDALEASGLYGGYNDMIAAVRSWIQNAK